MRIAWIRSASVWLTSGPVRSAAVIVPWAITPWMRPPPSGAWTPTAVEGYSQTTIGPFTPGAGVSATMWMCAMNTFSMFEAMSLYSSVFPSGDRWKIAWACPFESRGGTSSAPLACTLQFAFTPATAAVTTASPSTNSPSRSLPLMISPSVVVRRYDPYYAAPPRPDCSRSMTSRQKAAARTPSTTRWSKLTETLPTGRITTSPSRTTGRSAIRWSPRIATSG